jgi:hypothetical protein
MTIPTPTTPSSLSSIIPSTTSLTTEELEEATKEFTTTTNPTITATTIPPSIRTTTTTSTPTKPNISDGQNAEVSSVQVGTVVGSIIGALVFVTIAGGLAYYFLIYKKKSQKKINPGNEDNTDEFEATVV